MKPLFQMLFRELTKDSMESDPRYPVRPAQRTYPVVKPKAQVLVYWGANDRFPELRQRWLERGYDVKISKGLNLELVEIKR